MKRFPNELEELLSPRGRRLLAGKDPLAGALGRDGLVAAEGLLDASKAAQVAPLLQRTFGDVLVPLEKKAPPANQASVLTALERLPKTVRTLSTPWGDDQTSDIFVRASECGLVALFRSPSFLRFAEVLSGERLWGPSGMQVLCYRAGDYAGPHTDHHPENPQANQGYFDFHLTFCTGGVKRQLLVFERDSHLSEVRELTTVGGLTAYRLPFWHYTTPLEVSRPSARRWILLNSFFFADRVPEGVAAY